MSRNRNGYVHGNEQYAGCSGKRSSEHGYDNRELQCQQFFLQLIFQCQTTMQ
jgi:hypothetical protein